MKLKNILLMLLLCILFIGCGYVPIDLSGIHWEMDKKPDHIFKTGEEINIRIYGEFLKEDYITGGFSSINVIKNVENNDVVFELLKIDNEDVDTESKVYNDYLRNRKTDYKYSIKPKENEDYVKDFDNIVTISISEPGDYVLSGICKVSSKTKRNSHISIDIPFTITE